MDPQQLKIMIQDLIHLITEGGKMTIDERNLMISLNLDVKKFLNAYKKARDQNPDALDQDKKLRKLWMNIYESNQQMATNDQKLNSKELKILMRIAQTILL